MVLKNLIIAGQRSKNRYKQNSIMSDFTDSNVG